MATAEQRYKDERPKLEEIADRVISTEAFRECLAQRPAEHDEFLVLVANGETTDGLVALDVRILELWEECKSGKIEELTFPSIGGSPSIPFMYQTRSLPFCQPFRVSNMYRNSSWNRLKRLPL
jgi:hypothetical protein